MPVESVHLPCFIPPAALLDHWQGHRRLTRRVIESFPEDRLFSFSIGSMRPFGALALEILSMAEPNDSRWLASLLRHGLVQGSFIPPRDIRELRDLTRRRRTLVSDGAAERNRVQKILEDANVKIGNVLSDVFGTSGQAMLEALLENKRSAAEIAELGHWSLAPKIPQIIEALEGHRMTDHHRLLIRQCLRHMRTIEEMIEELDKEIAVRLKPYQEQVKLACTVPGIKPTAAASILAETGMDMSPEGPFPNCHHLASWATICPGNNESAGKRRSGRTRQGNRWLRGTLTQARHAAGVTPSSHRRTHSPPSSEPSPRVRAFATGFVGRIPMGSVTVTVVPRPTWLFS